MADTDTRSFSRSLFWGLLSLAIALFLAGLFAAGAIRNLRRANDEITVTGSAKRAIRADYAVWRPAITSQSPSIVDASKEVATNTQRVLAFLKSQGVADSLITLKPLETDAIQAYGNNGEASNRPPTYHVTETFEIRSHDVDAMTHLAAAASTLAQQGIPLTGSAPEYLYTGLANIRIAMLAEATKDARTRAQEIAKSVDVTLGSVREVQLGVFQITPRNSTEVSDMGINDVSSVDKDITSVVHVSFSLK